jgi:Flp pilus assembly protein TadG
MFISAFPPSSRLASAYRCFVKSERGSVVIMVAAVLFTMVIAMGVAIDMSRGNTLQAKMGSALDTAGLAAGVAVSASLQTGGLCAGSNLTTSLNTCETGVAQAAANKYFSANFPAGSQGTGTFSPAVTVNSDGTLSLTANTNQTTDFVSIVGVNSVPVSKFTKISLGCVIGSSFYTPTCDKAYVSHFFFSNCKCQGDI